jgi:DUF2075 family protein
MFAGDGKYTVINRNEGITDADYFDRVRYRETFVQIFERLRTEGVFTRSIPEIENDDLFKLSPFKALNMDQAAAIENIIESLFDSLRSHEPSLSVVGGSPGTGKTIVAIFLIKLLSDIGTTPDGEVLEGESRFSELFVPENRRALETARVGFVIPQQSLRKSVSRVFKKTPGLGPGMVLSPFEVGSSAERFDILVVDEAHRLSQRANQSSGPLNAKFRDINERLFGNDDLSYTQLDWIRAQSNHQVLLFDSAQTVRPADLPVRAQLAVMDDARRDHRFFHLASQMRVRAGDDYIGYVRRSLSDTPEAPREFEGYDLRFFDEIAPMREAIRELDGEVGLARMVAGYAWPWVSKKQRERFDIAIDGEQFRWNSAAKDWINSPGAVNEMGSIHTVQGYDLNYAGVVIGPDLKWDAIRDRLVFDRKSYFDKKGQEDNRKLGLTYTDDDLLAYVRNVYAVLMTRGIHGTFIYVCDPALREHLRPLFSA